MLFNIFTQLGQSVDLAVSNYLTSMVQSDWCSSGENSRIESYGKTIPGFFASNFKGTPNGKIKATNHKF